MSNKKIIFSLLLLSSFICAGALAATQTNNTSTAATAGAYASDSWITTKVKAALVNSDITKAKDIEVETVNGVVKLDGNVDSTLQVKEAERIALTIKGVKKVENNLSAPK